VSPRVLASYQQLGDLGAGKKFVYSSSIKNDLRLNHHFALQ
jgi:hypothetical protein